MNLGRQALADRRHELARRSAAQRSELIVTAQPLLQTAASADRIVSRVRRHPVVVVAVAAAVVLFGSRRIFDLATRAFTLYALFRR